MKEVFEAVDRLVSYARAKLGLPARNEAYARNNKLEELRRTAASITDVEKRTMYLHDVVLSEMEDLRSVIDSLELLISSDYWPLPSYGDMLFYAD